MFANERKREIDEMIQKNGAVTTSDLVERFGVSIETIRRDLLNMEQQGRLLRVHGGAVLKADMKPYLSLTDRNKEYGSEKQKLSLKASEFVDEGDIIGIDSGSTAVAFAEALKKRLARLTVITHSMDVFQILCNHKEFTVILCGGHYMQKENAFYGELALDMLRTLHIHKAFICPSAVSLEGGIRDYQSDLYQIQKQMMASSDKVFVLADSSKFEKKALLRVDDMKNNYIYVTDCGLPEELVRLYKENNIKIVMGK